MWDNLLFEVDPDVSVYSVGQQMNTDVLRNFHVLSSRIMMRVYETSEGIFICPDFMSVSGRQLPKHVYAMRSCVAWLDFCVF